MTKTATLAAPDQEPNDVTAPGRTAPSTGLTALEALARLREFGPNDLVPDRPSGDLWTLARSVVTDPMAALLVVASVTYVVLGETRDAVVTALALVPILAVSVLLELRAERALEGLRRLTAPTAAVVRDGEERRIPAREVVPGDLLLLREGDIAPADGRLEDGRDLVVDESSLTGESHPVTKSTLGDEEAALFAGTTILAGRGSVVVTETGPRTRYGRIGTLVAEIKPEPTPLQAVIRRLFIQLAAVAAVFCVAVFAIELLRGARIEAALIAAVSLAMAAIPEELPMVFALYLGLGAWRLARDHALVRRLAGVETLGAANVICVDKTGTLTLGTIEVGSMWTAPGWSERDLLATAVLASEPRPYDPVDQAIVRAAVVAHVDVDALHGGELARDHPFDPHGRYVTHVWRAADGLVTSAKGALEGILARTNPDEAVRRAAHAANEKFATGGMRVIAVATGPAARDGDRTDDERALSLIGLIAFVDPLRPGVRASLEECRAAGIRVVVITGDHPMTARAVADAIGLESGRVISGTAIDEADDDALAVLLEEGNVFARIRPEQKYRIVRALRARGRVVAMTGDGTNDAPALREADIGIAMGRRGTEVARAAATLVLLDDDFSTIVSAVRDGRRIFENLRRAFGYLIAFHVPLLLSALVLPLAGAPLLLLPIHLVWLEIVVHPTASLVFEADEAAPDLMRRPPRRRSEGLVERRTAIGSIARGTTLTLGVLALYLGSLGTGEAGARGLAIATLILGQVFLVLAERSGAEALLGVGFRGNTTLGWILAVTVGSVVVAEYVPFLADLLHLAPPSAAGWALALAVAAGTTLWTELGKRRAPQRSEPAGGVSARA